MPSLDNIWLTCTSEPPGLKAWVSPWRYKRFVCILQSEALKPHSVEFQALLVSLLRELLVVVGVASLQKQLLAACMACLETLRMVDPDRQGTQVHACCLLNTGD